MVKTLKDLLFQNHWADCLETWFVAFGELVDIFEHFWSQIPVQNKAIKFRKGGNTNEFHSFVFLFFFRPEKVKEDLQAVKPGKNYLSRLFSAVTFS